MRKNLKRISYLVCLLFLLGLSTLSSAQQLQVSGTITDDEGEPLPGAAVIKKGTITGTIADNNGNYTLQAGRGDILVFSFLGMKTLEVEVEDQRIINVELLSAAEDLEEVVVVGYGQQKKVTITGALSTVRADELESSPTASISNSLAGKVTGLTSIQYSGQPGADAAELYLRGVATLSASNSSPLILVDGVERDFSQLNPEEVDDITVLKDASATAVYGIRGANGVILVTTKRGQVQRPTITGGVSYGLQQPTELPVFADSYTYATVYNNAQRSDGLPEEELAFSEDIVEAFRTNSEPILFPNTDWMDYIVRNTAPQFRSNFSFSGGTERLKYFAAFGYLNQEGMLKEFDTGTGENYFYKRYNYRTNVDINVTQSTELSFSLGGQSRVRNEPAKGEIDQLWRFLYRGAVPWSSAGIVDGKYIVGNGEYITMNAHNPLQFYYGGGSDSRVTNVLNFDMTFRQDLSSIIKGLKFRVKAAYNINSTQRKIMAASPDKYTAYYLSDFDDTVPEDDKTLVYPLIQRSGNLSYSESYGKGRNWYLEGAITYNRKFGGHEVGGLLLYNQRNTYYPGGEFNYLPAGYVGSAARFTYNYMTRYLAEINMGYNGSENFHEDYRYGFFPAFSLGWIISEERFIKDNISFLDYLKIRGSYGMVGSDRQGNNRFLFLVDSYDAGGGYNFGVDIPSNRPGFVESKIGNREVTWETAVKQNYGLDLKVFDNKLTVNFDYFLEDRKDILTTRQTVPELVAANLPAVNIGEVHNEGFEVNVRWDHKAGNLRYWLNPNMSHSKNEIVFMDEVPQKYDYLYRTGGLVGQPFGLVNTGFYGEEDFDEEGNLLPDLPVPSAAVKPGDAIYLDKNGDGVINSEDEQAIGYPEYPLYTYGFNSGLRYRNFDFRMSWVASTHTSRVLAEILKDPFGDNSEQALLQYHADNSWTPETAETATMPRISFANRMHNRFLNSDMWVIDASYLRLKNLEIGYSFKGMALKKIGAKSLRVYANGYNLLTFDRIDGFVDPETKMNSRPTHPAMKVYNVGLKANF